MEVRESKLLCSLGAVETSSSSSSSPVIKPYLFRMTEIEGFRYRVTVRHSSHTHTLALSCMCVCEYMNILSQDAMRAVTKVCS